MDPDTYQRQRARLRERAGVLPAESVPAMRYDVLKIQKEQGERIDAIIESILSLCSG